LKTIVCIEISGNHQHNALPVFDLEENGSENTKRRGKTKQNEMPIGGIELLFSVY
jgi:hypothetical protein